MGNPKINRDLVIGAVVILIIGVWLAIPMFSKWRANNLVNELCAKDGGMRIYEVIEVPGAPSFGTVKRPPIPAKNLRKEGDEFYFQYTTKDIRGEHSTDVSALTVYRSEAALYRAKDDKLLGVAVFYVRRGGDPVGPWHPSSYRCPADITEHDLVQRALIDTSR